MKEQEIKDIIIASLKKIAPDTEPEKLNPEDNIRETLAIDSFDFLRFIVILDKQLGINTPEEDYGKIRTISSLIAYIGSKKA